MSVYKQQLIDWLSQLDVQAETVIDIGGSQDPVKGRTKSWQVENYLIADLPVPHKEKQRPDIEIDLDKVQIDELPKADLIFCFEVFDYIRDPVMAFANIVRMLKPGGTAWVSLPFIYPIHQPVEAEGLRYTEPAIRWYGEQFNMPVQEIVYRCASSSRLVEYYSEDRFRAAKRHDHSIIGYIVRFQRDTTT